MYKIAAKISAIPIRKSGGSSNKSPPPLVDAGAVADDDATSSGIDVMNFSEEFSNDEFSPPVYNYSLNSEAQSISECSLYKSDSSLKVGQVLAIISDPFKLDSIQEIPENREIIDMKVVQEDENMDKSKGLNHKSNTKKKKKKKRDDKKETTKKSFQYPTTLSAANVSLEDPHHATEMTDRLITGQKDSLFNYSVASNDTISDESLYNNNNNNCDDEAVRVDEKIVTSDKKKKADDTSSRLKMEKSGKRNSKEKKGIKKTTRSKSPKKERSTTKASRSISPKAKGRTGKE